MMLADDLIDGLLNSSYGLFFAHSGPNGVPHNFDKVKPLAK